MFAIVVVQQIPLFKITEKLILTSGTNKYVIQRIQIYESM